MTSPLSLHVVRPFGTEAEFLDAEGWTVNARSVLLCEVGPEPEGSIVRLELSLASGKSLIVAEGIVQKHLPRTASRPSGLVVKFRRMSAASSDFVKRAVAFNADRPNVSSPLASAASVVQPPPAGDPGPAKANESKRPGLPRQSSKPPASHGATSPAGDSAKPPPRQASHRPAQATSPTQPPDARSSRSPRTSGPPRAGSVSVIPAARRASTVPPDAQARSAKPSTSPEAAADSALPKGSLTSPRLPREHSEALTLTVTSQVSERVTTNCPAEPKVVSETAHRDTSAMDRLKKRQGAKPITVPPDREAILARLKKP